MKVSQEKRHRKRTTKARTGCKTCKYYFQLPCFGTRPNSWIGVNCQWIVRFCPANNYIVRHVKCGEERPSCIQCTSTSRKCDGYDLPTLIWTTSKKSSEPQFPTLSQVPVSNSFNGQELRSLNFFLDKTTAQIGSPFSRNLWTNIVPLLAQSQVSIKHAVIALSGFHEQFSFENDSKFALVGSSLTHYNHAIQKLVYPGTTKPSPVISLLSCMLFFAIELVQGKLASALQLFKAGRRIIHEIRTKSSMIKPYEDYFSMLKAAYIRLEYNICALCNLIDKDLLFDVCYGFNEAANDNSLDSGNSLPIHVIAIFTSISQAQEGLRRIAHTFVNNAFSNATECISYKEILGNWCTAFEALKERMPPSLSIEDRWALVGLEIWWRQVEMTMMMMASDSSNCRNPLWFDQHERRMEEMIDYIEIQCNISAIRSGSRSNSGPRLPLEPLSPSFCLESGFVLHLVTVINRCRHPTIRRRALSVLKRCNRQEGFFRRDIAIKGCERLIELEERGLHVRCAADIPAEARAVSFQMDLYTDKTELKLRYLIGGEWVEERFPLDPSTALIASTPYTSKGFQVE